ncbi:hypothetical protein NG796_16995 [Laspinema sp. A4]|uniref:hypothetical protein n=1 Tax=Laspinema sp. D2d TaxID=2953686 RepID=UPI0021BB5BE5|nr:hypothetical protein [Laspinema sp. D2d]MCT7984971.1 hypothetical protein [Laspinema sp. D2d]
MQKQSRVLSIKTSKIPCPWYEDWNASTQYLEEKAAWDFTRKGLPPKEPKLSWKINCLRGILQAVGFMLDNVGLQRKPGYFYGEIPERVESVSLESCLETGEGEFVQTLTKKVCHNLANKELHIAEYLMQVRGVTQTKSSP